VAGDVADHEVDAVVIRLDRVVEVAAEQRPLAAGPIAGADPEALVGQQRDREQPALEAGGLLGQHLRGAQLLADRVGLPALDGVEDRAAQPVAVDAALDEVVLRARGDGLDPALHVPVAGQDEVRDARLGGAQALERAEAGGVREAEVEQHAVGRVGRQRVDRRGQRAHVADIDARVLLLQQLGDEERVALVVLDEQEPQRRCGGAYGCWRGR
jgi:hypothetical protein